MNKKPLNCWEFKKCGREPGGENVEDLGVCPAATERSLDAFHRGDNAGRCCWVIAGTYCGGTVQGSFADKNANCAECEFCKKVLEEEGISFDEAQDILTALAIVSRK